MDTVGSLGQKKKHKSCDRSKGVRQIRQGNVSGIRANF